MEMTDVKKWLADHVTFYEPTARAWFGIGPVWGPDSQVIGVSASIGRWAIAVHRRMDG